MLRISIHQPPGSAPALHMEGQLAGLWIDELRAVCEPLLRRGESFTLDLAGVSLIDRDGFAFLASLPCPTASVTGCSPFQAEQLRQTRTVQPATTTP